MEETRRDFIKKLGMLGGAGFLAASPLQAFSNPKAEESDANSDAEAPAGEKPVCVTILQTTDVHCQIHPHDELFWEDGKSVFRKTGGYGQLATYLAQQRKANPNVFVIDTGDMFQGSRLSVKTNGKAISPILDALQYDLYLPGNWEVIYGKRTMQTLLGGLQGPKVCANMYHDLGEGKRGELIFPPYHIWNVAGIKIGFLGYTDPLVPIRQSPVYSKGIIYTKPEENLAHFVDVLRNQEQCAFVCVVAHLGLSQQIHLANMDDCAGVDYILGGDTHERVRVPIACKHAKVVEPGAFGSFAGRLTLTIENGKVVADEYALDEISESKYKPAKQMESLIAQVENPFEAEIQEVLGYSTIPLYRYFVIENTIDTMILNALNHALPDVDIKLSNGFRFCPPRSTRDETGNIPITGGYLYDILPVDSVLRTANVTGKQIREWLEKELNNVFAKDASERFGGWLIKFKGMQMRFYAFGEKGKRVQEVKIGGKDLDPEKIYSVVACEREGDPVDTLCRIKNVQQARNLPMTLYSVMKDYWKAFSPVTPTPERNAVALDAPETLLTQVTGVDYQFR
jgi:sulfur-oxidizing protein SoxB